MLSASRRVNQVGVKRVVYNRAREMYTKALEISSSLLDTTEKEKQETERQRYNKCLKCLNQVRSIVSDEQQLRELEQIKHSLPLSITSPEEARRSVQELTRSEAEVSLLSRTVFGTGERLPFARRREACVGGFVQRDAKPPIGVIVFNSSLCVIHVDQPRISFNSHARHLLQLPTPTPFGSPPGTPINWTSSTTTCPKSTWSLSQRGRVCL